MARLAIALLALCAALHGVFAIANVSGVYGIVERRLPQHVGKFTFTAIDGEEESFVISDTPGKHEGITVNCTTTSACARGLYTYVNASS